MAKMLDLKLKIWRQPDAKAKGSFLDVDAKDIPETASFLEMLDIVNQRIINSGGDPVAFDHDCREGICGMCSLVINGIPHGPERATTVCQLHMRKFRSGDTLWIEPFRANAFPVIKDLAVDHTAFDAIMRAGGFISVRTGGAQDANCLPISKIDADAAMDAAACIGCGACVAACKNSSAMLFTSAKAGQLNTLPQGHPEKHRRTLAMVEAMDKAGFGNCTNQYECGAACPKKISVDWIAKFNRDFAFATLHNAVTPESGAGGGD